MVLLMFVCITQLDMATFLAENHTKQKANRSQTVYKPNINHILSPKEHCQHIINSLNSAMLLWLSTFLARLSSKQVSEPLPRPEK